MNREELYLVAEDAANDAELQSNDIPAIDLYVDQIINLVQAKLEEGSPRYKENRLTKTMINNYSKDGIITPVKGKKYNKEQILQMLTVYSLKNNISIGEIKRILDGAYGIEGFDGKALAGKPVKITQKNHAFKYGANIFMLDEFETVEKNEIYREKFPELFNLATLPFYWNSLEPEKGNFRFDKNSPQIYKIQLNSFFKFITMNALSTNIISIMII